MRWLEDIVKVIPSKPLDEDECRSIELYAEAGSYDEYLLRCACFNVEPLFTREEFDRRDVVRVFGV